MNNTNKPAGYESFLGNYGPQLYDGCCGEPIGWGFQITSQMPDDMFNNLKKFGSLQCSYPKWFLITKELTRQEAIEKYGEESNIERGPKGGFKKITFGKTTFLQKYLQGS